MQSFPRAAAVFSIVIASGWFVGCGGPGTPIPGGSDPASEAADAALAPEGGTAAPATESTDAEAPQDASESTPAAEGAAEESAAADAAKPKN